MIHDPLCRRAKITEVFMEGCPECALIAKVREEMQPACVCKFGRGYRAAISDARIAIDSVDPPSESYDDWYPKGKRLALEAIDALRRKENDEAG